MSSEMTFNGYGSVFGVLDSYSDIVEKGAYARTLREARSNGRYAALLWQHNTANPIGKYLDMREDEKGLLVEGQLLDTQGGREAFTLLKGGGISGMSIGFIVRKARYDERAGIRYILDLDLIELSLVTLPANDQARVTEVRSLSSDERELLAAIKRWGQVGRRPDVTLADLMASIERHADLVRNLNSQETRMQHGIDRAYVDPKEIERRKQFRANHDALAAAERLLASITTHNTTLDALRNRIERIN